MCFIFFYFIEPKCYCAYPLSEQKSNANKTTNEIMCEKNAGLQPSGECDKDEFCAGPNTQDEAMCGKKYLCTNKGRMFSTEITFKLFNLMHYGSWFRLSLLTISI